MEIGKSKRWDIFLNKYKYISNNYFKKIINLATERSKITHLNVMNDQEEVLYYTNIVVTSLSMMGCLFMILTYCCMKELHNRYSMKLIHCLVISNFFYTGANIFIMIRSYSMDLCVMQGCMRTIGGTASVFWAVVIAKTSYL